MRRLRVSAQRVLSDCLGTRAKLQITRQLAGGTTSTVLRMEVRGDGLPASVVVKAAVPKFTRLLFNDWAATELLTRLGADSPVCARFYGGDPEVPLIVLEDLGDGAGSPFRLVAGADPDAATTALIEYSRTLARLHGQARQHMDEFRLARQALGPVSPTRPLYTDPWSDAAEHSDADIDGAIASYRAVLNSVDVRPRPGVDAEIAAVTRRVEDDPGTLLGLCRGDMNGLEHCLLSAGALRVHDFGVCGYRHVLTEGMSHRVNWGCVRRLPSSVITAMDRAYQRELSRDIPELAVHPVYNQAATDALARWHIFHVISRLPEALVGDRPRGAATLRQQTVAWIDAFVQRHAEHSVLPALGDTAGRLALRLRRLWPPETHTIPYFPAFVRSERSGTR